MTPTGASALVPPLEFVFTLSISHSMPPLDLCRISGATFFTFLKLCAESVAQLNWTLTNGQAIA